MPRVPTLDGPQVRAAPLGASPIATPDVSAPARAMAAGTNALGDSLDRIAQRQDQDVAWRTQAKINEDWLKFDADARKQRQGGNARGYADEAKAWWDKAAQDYGADLSPSQRALISKNLAVARGQAYEGSLRFEDRELERSRLEALDGALSAEVSRGSAGGPKAAAASSAILTDMLQKYGAESGKPKEWIDQQVMQRTTAMHANVISSLMQTDPKAAQEYFTANKGQIDGARHDEIGAKLNQVSAIADGDAAADALWKAAGAGTPGKPVELDKLEAAAREQFKNDPTRQKATINGLRERLQAFDTAEKQREAAGINAVYKMLDAGTPLSRVQRTPEWQTLDGKSQDQVLYQQEQRAAARESRAAAAEARAAAAEARQDRLLLHSNADAYMRYSDPEVLARMTRPEVEATRSVFGFEGAQHLLSRWDSLQKPGAVAEAKMDTEEFNRIADELGLKPYATSKSEREKAALGDLKYRVEKLIDIEQQAGKKTLTREQKADLIRGEMARTVSVPNWFGLTTDQKPVIMLDAKDAERVKVLDGDRAKIVEALQTLYKSSGGSAIYAPTEDNVRKLYLMNRSRAATLIPPAK